MLIIDSASALADACARPLDTHLARLLALRCDQLGDHLEEAARFIVVEPPDSYANVEEAVGFLLVWRDADNQEPTWEWAERHEGGWIEAVFQLSDDGPADVLLVPDDPSLDPDLAALLRLHVPICLRPLGTSAA